MAPPRRKRQGVERDFGHAHSLLAAGKEEKWQEEQLAASCFSNHGTNADFGGLG